MGRFGYEPDRYTWRDTPEASDAKLFLAITFVVALSTAIALNVLTPLPVTSPWLTVTSMLSGGLVATAVGWWIYKRRTTQRARHLRAQAAQKEAEIQKQLDEFRAKQSRVPKVKR